ncbi:unnamed protein product, partial [Mesorhabditis spiculigera]
MTAIGSSQHLKSKYSTGYTLTLWLRWKKFADLKRPTKEKEIVLFEQVLREMRDEGKLPNAVTGEELKGWQHRFVVRRLDRHVRGIFPGAAIREAGESLTVSWQIPPHQDATWSVLWGKLIAMAPLHNDLLIEDYNITQCSLEDTFLDLLSHEEQKHRDPYTVYQQQSTGARYTPAPQRSLRRTARMVFARNVEEDDYELSMRGRIFLVIFLIMGIVPLVIAAYMDRSFDTRSYSLLPLPTRTKPNGYMYMQICQTDDWCQAPFLIPPIDSRILAKAS